MDILIVTTESHARLRDEYFLATLPRDADVQIVERKLDDGGGFFMSTSWQAGVSAKLYHALEYVRSAESGTIFALADVDIQFFPGFSSAALHELMQSTGADALFQKELRTTSSTEVNSGFYIARVGEWIEALLEAAIAQCEQAETKLDQVAINSVLEESERGKRWDFLPFSFYARSQGFPPPTDIVLHHANFSGPHDQKSSQMQRVRRYVQGGFAARSRVWIEEAIDYVTTGKLRMRVRPLVTRSRRLLGRFRG